MKTKRIRAGALLLALALVAGACGSGGDDDVAATEETVDAAQESEDDTESDDAMEDDAMEDAEGAKTVTVTIENIADFPVSASDAFAVPVGASEPAPVGPGESYEFTVQAMPGQRLSFATMFVQSNDWFFAPAPEGIELFEADGAPVSGDVTDQIFLFDAGTEVDQPEGEGADQAPRQAGPNTGADDDDPTVRQLDRDAANYLRVGLTPGDNGEFVVTIKNDSSMATTPTPIAPGVFAVHQPGFELFTVGEADKGYGLEALAEDGDPSALADWLTTVRGTSTPLAPGVAVVHGGSVELFALGSADAGLGMEALAEDGDPSGLEASLAGAEGVHEAMVFAVPDGADEPGPLLPGSSYSFEVTVAPGQNLSFATMFVQSNDWVFATPQGGLSHDQLTGDISDQLIVVDAGTEVDQNPGFGPDQAPRQAGPDTGAADEDGTARIVDGRTASRYITVTVEG
jgi:uncharacterized cupredoxin-like copper-binding protein